MQGRFQNMHVYTQTETVVDDNGDKRESTKGIMPVSAEIPQNPEVFVDQGRSSHKEHLQNNVSTASVVKMSKGRIFSMQNNLSTASIATVSKGRVSQLRR